MALSKSEQDAFREFEKSGWEQASGPYHRLWGNLSRQSAGAMLDAARVESGSRILDIATGAGYIAAAAMERGAAAVGIDFSPAQVELAQVTYPAAEFLEASAEDLPFDPDTFDAVVMGFGMNHLPQPEAAFKEAYRVLKPGGWFAFTIWAAPETGQGFGIVLSAVDEHGASVSLPPAPPYFRFADPEQVGEVFAENGFVDAATEIVPQYWRHSSADELFEAFSEGAVRATAMLRAQPPDARQAIRSKVKAEVMKLKDGDEYVIPVPAALSYGRKP